MSSEIRVNKINNRAGLGTVTYTDTGIIVSGISTASNFKTGTSDLHSAGLNVAYADVDDFVDVGNIIKLGNAGVITATSYVGSGAKLTGIVTSIVAGSNITVSGSTGQVTISSSGGGGTGGKFVENNTGIHTLSNVGIGTNI